MLVADGLQFLWSVLGLLFDAKFVLMVVFSCPVSDCTFDGPLKRVLAHLHSSHHPNDCPAAFVEENKLVQCSDCSQWFTRLGQHLSKCAASRLSSSGRTTDVGVTPPHSSGISGQHVCSSASGVCSGPCSKSRCMAGIMESGSSSVDHENEKPYYG